MRWFNNMRIRTKLISCFIVLTVLSCVLGIIGIMDMRTLNSRSESMYSDNLIPIQRLKEVQVAFQDIRANHVLAVYERNPATYQNRVDAINELVRQNNERLAEYEEIIKDDETNQALYDEVMKTLANYRELREANLELVKNGDYEEALATLNQVTEARLAADKAVEELVSYNITLADKAVQDNSKNFRTEIFIMSVVLISSIVIAIVLGIVVSNIISKQLGKLVSFADQIADGNLDVSVEINSKDEIGKLGQAFRRMADNINDVMTNINSAAEQVSTGAKQISDSSIALSHGAVEQASSVEELTASLEEISSQTTLNASNADKANTLAREVQETALEGKNQVNEMLQAMEDISDSSNNISKIIKVIDDIAFQTNILALNAAVEAARAGQYGKGFAVVAEEVRTLAARSAKAAKETTEMIENSIKKVVSGTSIAKNTANSLNEMADGIEKVAYLVNDIAVASNEQAIGIGQISEGISQVSSVVQTNSATSEESAAASEELSNQADLLKEMVNKFKLKNNASMNSSNFSPEIIQMLESMAYKNKKRELDESNPTRHEISLSDHEFGKY